MAATGLITATAAARAATAPGRDAGSASADHSILNPAAAGAVDPSFAASAQARATGKPVLVDALTTETSQTVANADGTFTWNGTPAPSRVKRSTGWVPVDATLKQNADGSWSPAAVPGNLVFPAAGSRAMATMTDEAGHTLTYTWPTALPTPTVSGSTAVYPNVFPGVDLSLTAGETGAFENTLIVHDATAAADPQLASLHLGLSASAGLSTGTDAGGNGTVHDAAGNAVFNFGAPLAWDSALPNAGSAAAKVHVPSQGAASDSHHPGLGAHRNLMAVKSDAGGITITPGAAALKGSGLVFPLYLDPLTLPSTRSTWDEVEEGYPTTSNTGNTSVEDLGIGYQGFSCPCGRERAYFQVNLPSAAVNSTKIMQASILANQDYAANTGSSYDAGIYLENAQSLLTSSTTWNNQPTFNWVATFTDPAGASNNLNFDITSYADSTLRANHTPVWAFMFYNAQEGGSDNYFKRVQYNPTVSMTYDNAPPSPTDLSSDPVPYKTSGAYNFGGTCDTGWIGASSGGNFTVKARVTSSGTGNSNVRGDFPFTDTVTHKGVAGWGPWVGSGTVTSMSYTGLVEGDTYSWTVNTDENDSQYSSILSSGPTPSTGACYVRYDKTPPTLTLASVGSTAFPATGGTTPATVGTSGTFHFAATDAPSGVWCIEYAIDGYLNTSATPCAGTAGGGNANVSGGSGNTPSWTANIWGTHFVSIAAVDLAGNRSTVDTYSFYVKDNPNATAVTGNLTGGGTPQLAAVNSASGDLVAYTMTGDPTSAGQQLATANQAPYGASWNNTLVTHRGSSHGNSSDDLFAWSPNVPSTLYLYDNSGGIPPFSVSQAAVMASHPDCSDNNSGAYVDSSFACYQGNSPANVGAHNYAPDWRNVQAITALGTISGFSSSTALLTSEADANGGANLWLYPSNAFNSLDVPFLLSARGPASPPVGASTTWSNYDFASPGDINSDGLPDLWVRDRATGTLYSATITTATDTQDGRGTSMPVLGGLTQVATGITPALYPQLDSIGDFDASGHAALFATTLYGNTLVAFPGTGTAGATSGLGTAATVTPANWTGTIAAMQGSLRTPAIAAVTNQTLAGKCVDDYQGGLTNGTVIDLYGCNNTWAQSFVLQPNGTVTLDASSGMCIEIANAGVSNGSKVDLSACASPSPSANQVWLLQPDGSGHTRMLNPSSGRCLDDPGSTTTNGTQLQISDCTGANGQTWGPATVASAQSPISLWQANDAANPTGDTMSHHSLSLIPGTGKLVTFVQGVTTQGTDKAINFPGLSYGDTGAKLLTTSQSFTVSAWVNLASLTGTQTVISQSGTNASAFNLMYDSTNGKWEIASTGTDSTTATITKVSSPAPAAASTWTMVTAVYDQPNAVLKLYVNGAYVQDSWPTPAVFSAPNNTIIGRSVSAGTVGSYLNGSIDNIRVYSTVLSDAQIAQLYATHS